jgi:hypothetical protein
METIKVANSQVLSKLTKSAMVTYIGLMSSGDITGANNFLNEQLSPVKKYLKKDTQEHIGWNVEFNGKKVYLANDVYDNIEAFYKLIKQYKKQ